MHLRPQSLKRRREQRRALKQTKCRHEIQREAAKRTASGPAMSTRVGMATHPMNHEAPLDAQGTPAASRGCR